MTVNTLDLLSRLPTLVVLCATALAYTVFLAQRIVPTVRPEVPEEPWPLLATASAVTTAALALTVSASWAQAAIAFAVPIFVVAASIDSKTRRIPNVLVLHGLIVCAAAGALASASGSVAGTAAAAGFATFIVFLALNIGSRNGFGMGDVKLGAVMVFLLALITGPSWSGTGIDVLDNLLLAVLCTGWAFLSFFIGGLWISAGAARGNRQGVPFGPFMVLAWFAVVAAAPLIADLLPRIR